MEDRNLIGEGSEVLIHYTLTLEDGTEVDSNRDQEPLRFVVGDGTLEAGLERRVREMAEGERKRFTLEPGEAFGLPDSNNAHVMARSDFGDLDVEPGSVISFTTPSGEDLPGTVLDLWDDSVLIDFNHPLAGKRLLFEVKLLSVIPSAPAKE